MAGFDGKPLSKLCNSVAKIKPTGDMQLDEKMKGTWAKKVAVIDRMEKEPFVVSVLHDYMIGNDMLAIATASEASLDWTGKYQSICRLPAWYQINWILEHAKQEGVADTVNKQCLVALESSSHEKIILLLVWITQLPSTQSLPMPECHDQKVCSLTLTIRATEMGSRLAMLVKAGGFSVAGELDFAAASYSFIWKNAEYVESVVHTWTQHKVDLPSHVVITQDFDLHDNHLDHEARFTCGGTTHTLANEFNGAWKAYLVNFKRRFNRLNDHAKAACKQLAVPEIVPEHVQQKNDVKKLVQDAEQEKNAERWEAAKHRLLQREDGKKEDEGAQSYTTESYRRWCSFCLSRIIKWCRTSHCTSCN